jgi:hypothetical protein
MEDSLGKSPVLGHQDELLYPGIIDPHVPPMFVHKDGPLQKVPSSLFQVLWSVELSRLRPSVLNNVSILTSKNFLIIP